jgi:hypothetical protein
MALACAMAHAALSTPATAATNAEREARARDIRQASERLDAELAAHGGSFEKWAESLKDYREDIARAKGPHMGGLQFQSQSIRIIRTDDLDAQPEGYRPFDAIVAFDRQLKERGIDLIVAIIPSKLCVYPDYLVVASNQAARAPADRQVAPCIKRLHKKLLEANVEVVDLYTAFQEACAKQADAVPYVYAADSHWKNAGARVAKVLPAAAIKPGDTLAVKLTPWSAVEKTYGRCQRGSLPQPEIEIEKPHYLAELPGAPTMTADDVRRGGEE